VGRSRRVVTAIALSVVAMGLLSACREDAGSAAFVGNTRITEAYVDKVAGAVPVTPTGISATQARQLAITYTTFNALAAHIAQDEHLARPVPTADQTSTIVTDFSIPAADASSNEFVKVLAQANAWENLLASKAAAAKPTDAELKQVYDNLVAQGVITEGESGAAFSDLKSQIAGLQGLGNAITLQRQLEVAAKKYDLEVNPRYAGECTVAPCSALQIPLLPVQLQDGTSKTGLYVRLDGNTDPVVLDKTVPAATPAASGS
jgi:polyhydroxyalkanoate synthesis regulator phasin